LVFPHVATLTMTAAFGIKAPGSGVWMSEQAGVVAVTCLALEAGIARGPGVSVICNQSSGLRAALDAAIARGASGIISFGIAGGLAPGLIAGNWVVASGVTSGKGVFATDRTWTQRLLDMLPGAVHAPVAGANQVVQSPREKWQLYDETRAAAVDLESHIAAEIAAEHRIPFAACRVILDAAHRMLPPAATLGLRFDGAPNVPAVFRSVLQEPAQLPDLLRVAIDHHIARRALRSGRRQLGVGLGFPYYNDIAFDRAFA
jgi:adenosylhomocysteine nucleosidase